MSVSFSDMITAISFEIGYGFCGVFD